MGTDHGFRSEVMLVSPLCPQFPFRKSVQKRIRIDVPRIIAAQAGITHTPIYHYFTSVEAILATLISHMMSDFDRETAD